jgi:hypothetical protein
LGGKQVSHGRRKRDEEDHLDHRGARRAHDRRNRRAGRSGPLVRGRDRSEEREGEDLQIREDEGGGTFKVKVNRQTIYQGISGFKAITVGRTDLEVIAQKSNGRWIASKVETRGGSGGGGTDG